MSLDVRIELDADASIDYLDDTLMIDTPEVRITLGAIAVDNILTEVLTGLVGPTSANSILRIIQAAKPEAA